MGGLKNTRRIVFPGIDRSATSSPTGSQFNPLRRHGYEVPLGKWMIVPAMSFQYISLGIDGYTESGAGALNLDVDRQTTESFQGNIGGKLYYRWETGNNVIMPGISASYGHEFLRGAKDIVSRLAQEVRPSGSRPLPGQGFCLCGAGVSMFTSNNASFHLGLRCPDRRKQVHRPPHKRVVARISF